MNDPTNGVHVVTILGTSRPGNYTGKALRLVDEELEGRGARVTSVDPAELELGFPGHPVTADAKRLQSAVQSATGVVLATPEYHGCFASELKLMIENLGYPSALAGKPIALLGVASGRIGAVKSLEQLRCVSSHVGGIVLPGPVSVANVNKVFDSEGNCLDEGVEQQIRGLARSLMDYVSQNICPRIALEAMVREKVEAGY